MIRIWEPDHSLVEDAVSGAGIAAAPCLPALAVTCLPFCLQGGYSRRLALLWYSLNPLFCECTKGYHVRLKPSVGKVFFFLSLWQSYGLGCSHISSLRLSSWYYPKHHYPKHHYAACTSLPSLHSLVADVSIWATSPLAVAVRHIFCGVFVFARLWCSLRFQNSPQINLWEGFLLCGNFSSFTTPSPGWVSVRKFLFLFLSFIFCPTSF